MPTFYEFFAGGGMARAGLGPDWTCLFANDFDQMKGETYRQNWGQDNFLCEDIAKIQTKDLPGKADLIWASFPCQDLSLAGNGKGIGTALDNVSTRSGTFWSFCSVLDKLNRDSRPAKLVVLENVVGILTSKQGRDFRAIVQSLIDAGYRPGAMVLDARWFLPQSRPRVFIVAAHKTLNIPNELIADGPQEPWTTKALLSAYAQLDTAQKGKWVWWSMPTPTQEAPALADILESDSTNLNWHSPLQTQQLLASMTPRNRQKVEQARASGTRKVGTLYKRTRPGQNGSRSVRAEVRFDDTAGCLRTPSGGSSRQSLLIVEGATARSRLLSAREAARLMGLPDTYMLPRRYNDAYHVVGDGVAVPAVRHLAEHIIAPALEQHLQHAVWAAE